MNTPAHMILGAAVFGRPGERQRTLAAVTGSLAPDLSLYLLAGGSIFVLGIAPARVFGSLYYSDLWQQIFAIDNSFVLWGIGLACALWTGSRPGQAFTGAALLHLSMDFPFHSHDARMHFWPLTDWKFHSPLSYWDGAAGGDMIGRLELWGAGLLTVLLVLRFRSHRARIGFVLLGTAELAPPLVWRLLL